MDPEEYVERVLTLVERVPRGRVTTYGAIADAVGTGGPRQVGNVMANYGGPVPWWRVVRADGRQPACHDGRACQEHLAEGTPLTASGRVDMRAAFWQPPALSLPARTSPPEPAPGGSARNRH